MPDAPDPSAGSGEQRELLARPRAAVEAKDAENALLRAGLAAEREQRRLELRLAELERRHPPASRRDITLLKLSKRKPI